MAVERRYNDEAQALVNESWAHIRALLRDGTTELPGGRVVKLTDPELVKMFQWLANFAPPKTGAAPDLNFTLKQTMGTISGEVKEGRDAAAVR